MNDEERDKTQLEIAELRQKLRWEPIRSIATFLGVAVVIVGLGVERCNQDSERRFEVVLKHQTESMGQMTKIISDVESLCRRTYSVIRANEVTLVTSKAVTETLRDRLIEATKTDDGLSLQREAVIAELSSLEERIVNEFDELRYWKDAVDLEGEWLTRENAPTPDFELQFGAELLSEWSDVHAKVDSALKNSFGIFGSATPDYEGLAETCNGFLKKLNTALNAKATEFCETYASRGPLCR